LFKLNRYLEFQGSVERLVEELYVEWEMATRYDQLMIL
jgi:hypothetical protein